MDKVMKAEIEKILEGVLNNDLIMLHPPLVDKNKVVYEIDELRKWIPIATSSITSLIIKWLESKREQGIKFHSGRQSSELSAYSPTDNQKVGRNQLITELVEEMKL